MAGHVFIIPSDMTKLYCDAWLLPCNDQAHVTHGFYDNLRASGLYPGLEAEIRKLEREESEFPVGWSRDGIRVISLLSWRAKLPANKRRSVPYLVNVGGGRRAEPEWFAEGARQFCELAAEELTAERRLTANRAKPLVALPFIGSGQAGGWEFKGALLRALLPLLYACARDYDVDIALVLIDWNAFIAAQKVRRELFEEPTNRNQWPGLSDDLQASAKLLAAHAHDQRLVLFLGSGVSAGAGLPDWNSLLTNLAGQAGFTANQLNALKGIHVLDQAEIIEHQVTSSAPDGEEALGAKVANLLASPYHSLSHSLLAGLPVHEVVTLNYDRLFEQACETQGAPVAVLPYESARNHRRWLLKMHGCVSRPSDIVLTRRDYLRYTDQRAALFGLVQALLITRHMLFVGFGLRDDNFHRIVDDVRKAVRVDSPMSGHESKLGTALIFNGDDLHKTLFANELDFVHIQGKTGEGPTEQARLLEIFLDCLLSETARVPPPLLNDSFEAILTKEEKQIRCLLRALQAKAGDATKSSSSWKPIRQLLKAYGADDNQGVRPAPAHLRETRG